MLPVKASWFPLTIKATKIGYETGSLDIKTSGNYDARLFLNALKKENISRGQVAIYKIKAIADDVIELTPLNTASDWKSKYKRDASH